MNLDASGMDLIGNVSEEKVVIVQIVMIKKMDVLIILHVTL